MSDARTRAKELAERIVALSLGEDPRIFMVALGVAADGYMHGIWPRHMHAQLLDRHINHLRLLALDTKPVAGFR